MVGCLSLALKFSIPTGCCWRFQGNGGQLRDAHPAAHPFNSTMRRDVLSRRDLCAARNGPISSQVQSGSISDSGQGCRVCLGLGGASCQSRAVAWCAATNFSARERKTRYRCGGTWNSRFTALCVVVSSVSDVAESERLFVAIATSCCCRETSRERGARSCFPLAGETA